MKLRKECPHGFYDKHNPIPGTNWTKPPYVTVGDWWECPGGEFLADDALIERIAEVLHNARAGIMWPDALKMASRVLKALTCPHTNYNTGERCDCDALTVREDGETP